LICELVLSTIASNSFLRSNHLERFASIAFSRCSGSILLSVSKTSLYWVNKYNNICL
jgi:hypothetical protein